MMVPAIRVKASVVCSRLATGLWTSLSLCSQDEPDHCYKVLCAKQLLVPLLWELCVDAVQGPRAVYTAGRVSFAALLRGVVFSPPRPTWLH